MLRTIHPYFSVTLLILTMGSLLSCSAPKNTAYFQTISRDTVLQHTVSRNFDLKIAPDDLLAISIASASPELSGLFNASSGAGATSGAGASSGYLVDKKGNIRLYKLGDVKVAGLTRAELRERLQQELAPYLKEPVVTVQFANHRITVLGEVGSPGVKIVPNEQLTLLEAIGQSGDLTEKAKKNKVLVIRQTEAGKEFRHLNLLDHSVFASPYFYLQNEDVVYVEPEKPKQSSQQTQQIISYVITGISLLTLLFSRIN
jgi:polysaccharide export outer membrane protein